MEILAVHKVDGELRVNIPITRSAYQLYGIMSFKIANLLSGDILKVTADCEITNEYSYNIGIGRYLTLGKNRGGVNGIKMSKPKMENVTPAQHHGIILEAGSVVADETKKWVTLVLYAASSNALPGHSVRVEQGYGQMIIEHIR